MDNQLLVDQPINNQSQLFNPSVVPNDNILGDTQSLDTLVQKHAEAYLDTTIQPMMVHVIDRQLDFVKQEITELTTTRIEAQFNRLYQTLENNRHDMRDLLQEFSMARQQITQQHKQLVHKLCDDSKSGLPFSVESEHGDPVLETHHDTQTLENNSAESRISAKHCDAIASLPTNEVQEPKAIESELDRTVAGVGSISAADAGFAEHGRTKQHKKLLDRLYIGVFSMSLIIVGSGMTYLALNAM